MKCPQQMHSDILSGVTVFERGWLSSNNILIRAALGEAGAVLVDTGHLNHAAQTLSLVRAGLAGRPLKGVVNTHLHSDHCGGNALLQHAFGMPITVPPGQADAVRVWDEALLGHAEIGQHIERFSISHVLAPGEVMLAGGREWQVVAAPGHDPHSVMLFDAAQGVLISADALWENGFGVVFPELVGEPGFDDVGATLDSIAALPVRLVIPGHGAPFTDVAAALARARSRLAAFKADPAKHDRHAVKVLIKYHLMEERVQALSDLLRWVCAAPMLAAVLQRGSAPATPPQWAEQLVRELISSGALAIKDGVVVDV